MDLGADYRVRDLAEMTLSLRSDLAITPRHDGDEPGYVIEDRVNGKYYRVGVPEYTFIALLDGKTTVREAIGVAAHVEPEHALTEERAATVCRWLVDNELASTAESASLAGLETRREAEDSTPKTQRWNPLFQRVSLLRPDSLLRRLQPWFGWVFSWPATAAGLFFVVFAAHQVLAHWSRLVVSSRGVFSTERWFWIAVAWLVVKALHELAHGLVCKRYGGSVRDAGIVLMMGAPLAYMDVSSSWSFRSKWQRIHTALAGIYIELLIAAVAAVVWSRSREGVLSDLCFQVMILAGVTNILFNANPLMRFDGYYVLSDILELPNLYGESRQFWWQLVRKYVLGLQTAMCWNRALIYTLYGAAASFWRVITCCGIALAAATAFRGAGVIIAVVAIGLWTVPPLLNAVKYLLYGTPSEQPRRLRILTAMSVVAAALTSLAIFAPWPGSYRAPAIVEYEPLAVVRTASDGFVRKIRVATGQHVERGQILIELENELLRLEVAELKIRVRQSASRVRALRYEAKVADSQSEREQVGALRRRLNERQQRLDGLILRAPVAGTVVAYDLNSLQDTYVERGAEMLAIGSEDRKQLIISISQRDVDLFSEHLTQELRVRVHGVPGFETPLTKVSPRARREPTSQGFCAPLGGPLPVRVLTPASAESDAPPRYEFIAPRFDGNLFLLPAQSRLLAAGQRGFVSLRTVNRSVADHLISRIRHWYRENTRQLPQIL